MKKFLISLSFLILFCSGLNGQEYKTHKVLQGETIVEIAKTYMVTPFDIYALNPDAKSELKVGDVIIIPRSRVLDDVREIEEVRLLSYKSHKVKRQETLYSIAQRYDVSIEDLKKHNSRLYSENLRKGDKINIPNFGKVKTTTNLGNTLKTYRVLPKEGKWRVAYKFGISVSELETINPKLGDSLQEGQELNVPNIANNEERVIDEEFGYYTVLPKEGFYRLNIKLGLPQEELEALNPELIEGGLKEGMILKVPLDATGSNLPENVDHTSLVANITNYSAKKLALMLPFRLQRIDLDSIEETKENIKKDRLLSISLDFHSGVLMALDSAKSLGITSKLDVFDTKGRISDVNRILSAEDFSDYDAVIGPLTAANFNVVASSLNDDNIPAISPVSKPNKLYKNVFQTIPSDATLRSKMIEHIKTVDTIPSNIFIIADSKNRIISNQLKSSFPRAIQIFSRIDEEGIDGYYIVKEDVEELFQEGRNIVFLETSNEGFVSNVTSMLNAFNGVEVLDDETEIEREIILVTTNRNRVYDSENISNYNLSDLKFHYPSPNRVYDYELSNSFVSAYKRRFYSDPNKYAIRGFDLTLDILLRLASSDDLYTGSSEDVATQYVENKFRYSKKLFGGYYNEAVYINKYEDLKIVEVKQLISQ